MMWARSVMRSNTALHNRALGMTCVHSENGRLVVNYTAERSARSAVIADRGVRAYRLPQGLRSEPPINDRHHRRKPPAE